jgi:hypothetical protein
MLRRLHFDHLWVAGVLVLVAGFIALVPTSPHDFWWHIRVGQLVATEGIPGTNRFAWTLPYDTPFVYGAWLGEWLFYQIIQAFGLPGAVWARNILGLAAFGLVALDARFRSGSWRLAALAVLLAGLISINNLPVRTQNWAWLPFGVYAFLLAAFAGGWVRARWLIALPFVMMFWVNVHGTFVLGIVLLAIYAVGETLRLVFKQPGALAWQQVGWLYLVAAGSVVACLLNPLGLGIAGYVARLLADQPVQTLIVEWQSPSFDHFFGKLFYGTTLALVAAIGLARRRPSITDMLLICAFLWLALGSIRSVMWFGMIAMPILAQSLAAPADMPERPVGSLVMNWLIVTTLAVLWLALQPSFKERLPLPQAYRSIFAEVPGAPLMFDRATPVEAAAWLRANPDPQMRLFNDMAYGSYLIWALPDVPVFIDPRIELFPLAQWQEYIAISDGTKARQLLDSYRVSHVLLNRGTQAGLQQVLNADSTWKQVYQDRWSAIYQRQP